VATLDGWIDMHDDGQNLAARDRWWERGHVWSGILASSHGQESDQSIMQISPRPWSIINNLFIITVNYFNRMPASG